jgi:dipeptidyl aminopeptidase/acylaminoacyl peptidase
MRVVIGSEAPMDSSVFNPSVFSPSLFNPSLFSRRRFLQRSAAVAGALPLAALAPSRRGAHAQPVLPARHVFFENPDYTNVRLSPDGEHLAFIAPVEGVRNLWLAPVASPQQGQPLTRVGDRDISTYFFWAYTNRHLVFFQDRNGDENWRASSVDIATGAIVPLTPPQGVRAAHQESSYRFPGEMLFRHNERDKAFFDLYRINVITGKSELLYENHDYVGFVTDSTFRLRLAVRYAANGDAECFERRDNGWIAFDRVPITDIDSTHFIDFSDDCKTLYMLDTRGRDKAALVAVDMATRQSTVLAQDDAADIVAVEFEPRSRRPLAAVAISDRKHWHAIEPSAAADLAMLARYGAGDPEFVSRSADNGKVTAYLERDASSGEYVLIDHAAAAVRPLFVQRAALAQVRLQPMQPVVIAARDGLKLNGYLTMPAQSDTAASAKVPMVLLVHGGPYFRDTWGFNATHQWLASRGYAVLSVNYRGSTGFGKAFVTAADRQWGGRMHDDLIDAVQWAIDLGFADPNRIGFYGGSYGGYSALMAATKTPEVFTCIVDAFGISNLITFMATVPPYWGPWFSIWKNRLGDPATDEGRAFLRDRSPLNHIERATRPILIAQGMRDVRVVAAESEQMVTALEAKRVPVTYLTFSDEGHGFVRPENRLAFTAVTEAFLAAHLGGQCQPIGDDFAGSTIKIEAGGELVPGLVK